MGAELCGSLHLIDNDDWANQIRVSTIYHGYFMKLFMFNKSLFSFQDTWMRSKIDGFHHEMQLTFWCLFSICDLCKKKVSFNCVLASWCLSCNCRCSISHLSPSWPANSKVNWWANGVAISNAKTICSREWGRLRQKRGKKKYIVYTVRQEKGFFLIGFFLY